MAFTEKFLGNLKTTVFGTPQILFTASANKIVIVKHIQVVNINTTDWKSISIYLNNSGSTASDENLQIKHSVPDSNHRMYSVFWVIENGGSVLVQENEAPAGELIFTAYGAEIDKS